MINSQSRNLYTHGKTFPGSKPDNDEKRFNEMGSTNNTRQTFYAKLVRNAKSAHNTKLTYNAKLAHNAKSIHDTKLINNAKLAHNSKPTYNATMIHNAKILYSAKLANNVRLIHNAKLTYNAKLAHNAKPTYNATMIHNAKLTYHTKSTDGATLFNSANAGSDEIPIKEIRQVYGSQYVHLYGGLHIKDTSKTYPPLSCQSRPSQSYLYLSYHMRPVIFAILRGTPNSNQHNLASSMFTRAGPLTRASIFTKTNPVNYSTNSQRKLI